VILAMAGKTDEAKEIVAELKRSGRHPLVSHALAETCSVMGEKTEAFEFLEAAYQGRASQLVYLGITPTFDNIRSDPRFANLLRRIGLPQLSVPTPTFKQAKAE
jgi:hypothetical protein